MNKIYLLSQKEQSGYDTYDSMIVVAENEDMARKTDPAGHYKWDTQYNGWLFCFFGGKTEPTERDDWANTLSNITVKYLGETDEPVGVVLASFNAG